MTSLPMPPGLSEAPLAPLAAGAGSHGVEEEQYLLRAFRTFAETAGSLERFYCLLQAEVARLRQELEESHAGLARSLEENRSMRQHLDRILESLPCGVVVVSSSGEITHLNPEGKRLLGLEEWSAFGAAPGSVLSLRGELRQLLDGARVEGGEGEPQVWAVRGPVRWLAVRHAALPASVGGAAVFILQDVSERKRLEQEQDKHRRQQALAEMSAVLAHEVRNPLGSLELFASLLAEADLGSECQEWIEHLQHGLRTLAATVNNVLHFHSAPPPERTPVDLGQMLDWAGSFLAPLARRTGVKLILHNGLRRVLFSADRHQLEQVLLNLSLNALRVMPGGGRLTLAGQPVDGASSVAIAVSDTGPGIPAENLAEIFAAGFTTRAGSPGLGLAVCRRIVEQHAGTIAVASRAGEGAAFTLKFSLAASLTESSLEKERPS